MKKIAFFLAAMCCAVSLYADCERGGNCGIDDQNLIAWTYNEGVLSFKGSGVMASYDAQNPSPWDCWKDEVTAVVFEHNVTFIAEYAFYGFSHLATVQLPTDSFVIGKYAFAGCTALEEVIIPAKVKYIRKNAFNGAGLQTVYLLGAEPFEFLDYGGYDVPFNGCASLANIYVPVGSLSAYQAYWSANEDNASYVVKMSEGAPAYPVAGNEFVVNGLKYQVINVVDKNVALVANGYTGEVNIPNKVIGLGQTWNVTAIGASAFEGVALNINPYSMLRKVKEVGARAFYGCAFNILIIPENVKSIGAEAFAGNTALASIEVRGEEPATLGANAFAGTASELEILVPADKVAVYKAAWSAYADKIYADAPYKVDVEIGDFTYYLIGGNKLTAQITGVATDAKEVTIPASVTYEEDGITYTYNVNAIEPNAFKYAEFEKITIATELTAENLNAGIGVSVGFSFDKATLDAMLAAHTITQELYDQLIESFYTTGQGTNVFDAANTTLKEVVIADGVTHIPAGFFGGMAGIERVVIPASVTSIDEDAFLNCTGIQSVISYRTEPINLAGTYRVFPRKNKVRLLFVSYAARSAYKAAKWDTYFYFDEQEAAAETDQVNVSSLESEQTSDAELQATLEAMQQAAQTAEADPTVNVVTTNLTIQRKLYKDGYLNTICLPFDLATLDGTPLEGGEIFEFDHANVDMSGSAASLDMVVTPTDHMEAGKPYFIRWANTGEILEEMEFKNIVITQTVGLSVQGATGNVEFKGHLGMIHIEKEDELDSDYSNLYLSAGDQFRWPVANDVTNMKGFRAYFRVYVGGGANNSPRRGMPSRIVFGEKTTTAIDNAEVQNGVVKAIENGQLVIIREGVRYNAAGQIVK